MNRNICNQIIKIQFVIVSFPPFFWFFSSFSFTMLTDLLMRKIGKNRQNYIVELIFDLLKIFSNNCLKDFMEETTKLCNIRKKSHFFFKKKKTRIVYVDASVYINLLSNDAHNSFYTIIVLCFII